jgi:hypothetical protein
MRWNPCWPKSAAASEGLGDDEEVPADGSVNRCGAAEAAGNGAEKAITGSLLMEDGGLFLFLFGYLELLLGRAVLRLVVAHWMIVLIRGLPHGLVTNVLTDVKRAQTHQEHDGSEHLSGLGLFRCVKRAQY